MKKYIEHIKNTRTPHERRQWALTASGAVVAVLFVGWVSTLGGRFGDATGGVSGGVDNLTAAAAGAAAAMQQGPHLEVATSTASGADYVPTSY